MVAEDRRGTSMGGMSGWINQWVKAERKLRYSEKVWNGPLRYYVVTEV